MKKEQSIPAELDMSDSLSENKAIQWFIQNGRTLLWIFGAILLLILLFQRFVIGTPATGNEYLEAENEFHAFLKGKDPAIQEEALKKLSTLLKKHSDLQSKYDGEIAQTLLNRSAVEAAIPYAQRTFNRVHSDDLNLYENYAQTTFLIANKKYEEALKNAQDLRFNITQTSKGKEFGQTLFLFNQLRIAMLQQQLGNKMEELKAWEEFKQAPVSPKAFETVTTQLEGGKVSLLDYIDTREKVLKK